MLPCMHPRVPPPLPSNPLPPTFSTLPRGSHANPSTFLSPPLHYPSCPLLRPPRPAMAERVAPTPPRPPPPPRPKPTTTTTTTTPPADYPTVGGPSIPAPTAPSNPDSSPPRLTETYVVQVPKEQIYRVPPPENARLVEQYLNNYNNRHQRRPIVPCLKWTIGIALVLAILAAIIAIVYLLVVRPVDPSFSVIKLNMLGNIPNPRAGSGLLPKPGYDFTMRVENPSLRMGYSYEAGGKAILAHDGAEIAVGKTRAFDQGYQNATTFQLVLQGLHIVLPRRIQSSLKGSKDVIPMSLMIESSVGKTIGGMVMGSKSLDVTCVIKVSGLAKKEARIVSQECETKFT